MLRASHQGRVSGSGKRRPYGIEVCIYKRAKRLVEEMEGWLKGVRGLRQMGERVTGFRGTEQLGNTLCQHVPETAATQSCPAGCQARVSCVVPSPVLHHVHWREKKKQKQNEGKVQEERRAEPENGLTR